MDSLELTRLQRYRSVISRLARDPLRARRTRGRSCRPYRSSFIDLGQRESRGSSSPTS